MLSVWGINDACVDVKRTWVSPNWSGEFSSGTPSYIVSHWIRLSGPTPNRMSPALMRTRYADIRAMTRVFDDLTYAQQLSQPSMLLALLGSQVEGRT